MDGIFNIGMRDDSDWRTSRELIEVISTGQSSNETDIFAVIEGKEIFVSLDIDVLDPSIAPGTGTPVAGGLGLRELCEILGRITAKTVPVGMDIVELSPMLDQSGNTERAAVEALLWFLVGYHYEHQGSLS